MNAMEKIILMPKAAIPLNEPAERAAISCLMQNFANLDAMSWPEDLFFYEKHKLILGTIRKLHEDGVKTDFMAIMAQLDATGQLDAAGGAHELNDLHDVMPTGDSGTAAWHRGALMDARRYRTALAAIRKAEDSFLRQEGDIAAVAEALNGAAAMQETPRVGMKQLIDGLIADLEKTEPVETFGSGIGALDRVAHLKRGELLTVAAPTSGGKSIMLLQMALHALRAGKRVAVFSLEMPATQVVGRMLSAMCGFPVGILRMSNRQGEKSRGMSDKFTAYAQELAHYPLEVESNLTEWEAIDGAARELVAKDKADLIVVDYIQLIHLRALGSNETREQHVSEVSKRLKSLALHLNVAVATASQLNDDNPPKLRESRAIGHHSDHVWFVGGQPEEQFLTIIKNRDGERGGAVPVRMNGATATFSERISDNQPNTKS
jgi:replicative DNA helicase